MLGKKAQMLVVSALVATGLAFASSTGSQLVSVEPDLRLAGVVGEEYVSSIAVDTEGTAALALKSEADGQPGRILVVPLEGAARSIPLDLDPNGVEMLENGKLLVRGTFASHRYEYRLLAASSGDLGWSSAELVGTTAEGFYLKFSRDGGRWFAVQPREDFSGFSISSALTQASSEVEVFSSNDRQLQTRFETLQKTGVLDAIQGPSAVAWSHTYASVDPDTTNFLVVDSPKGQDRLLIHYGGQVYIADLERRGGRDGSAMAWKVRRLEPVALPSDVESVRPRKGSSEVVIRKADGTEAVLAADSQYGRLRAAVAGPPEHVRLLKTLVGPGERGVTYGVSANGEHLAAVLQAESGVFVLKRWRRQ